jgi:hypothetical protein
MTKINISFQIPCGKLCFNFMPIKEEEKTQKQKNLNDLNILQNRMTRFLPQVVRIESSMVQTTMRLKEEQVYRPKRSRNKG